MRLLRLHLPGKKRYRADVLIEDQLAKYDEKINKEVAKAAKIFGPGGARACNGS